MFYTYVLQQINQHHFYTGSTNDFKKRLNEHNSDKNSSTRGRKWKLYCYFAFSTEKMCRDFEQYLKSGSGRSFSKKHFEFKVDVA